MGHKNTTRSHTLCNNGSLKSMSDIFWRIFTVHIHRGHLKHLILQYHVFAYNRGYMMLSYSLKHRGKSYCSDLHNIVNCVLIASNDFKNEPHPKDKKEKKKPIVVKALNL